MNTATLKTFAPAVRRQLMEAVTRKLDFALTAKTPDFLTTYAPQVVALRKLEQADRAGLIERVAYTWFNRLAALRFMDARGWHPFSSRVLTPASATETQPELLKLTRTGSLPEELHRHTNPQRLNDLLDGKIPSPDAQREVYRSLILAVCHFYHALLPDIFEKLDDETELLLPDDLLTEHSIVHGFRTEISDEDCGEVEILGWLYQFYISEKKDQVMARKSAVPTEDIPAVTQLFTPHWIVRYLVENSLGRLWLLNHPGSKLRDHMPYYIEGEAESDFLKVPKPEEIRLLDPACGSGHMLTYAFDLLVLIYEEEGYAPSDIPGLILRHNLCGLEICPRAAQLAELALVFKAREKSRRFFQPEHLVRPNIIELREVRFADGELSVYFKGLGIQPSAIHPELNRLLHQFEEAKNFGSLIQPCLTESAIQSARAALVTRHTSLATADLMVGAIHAKVLRVLEQAETLTQRYHVAVANPPYMGFKGMNGNIKAFAEGAYCEAKADLFAMFIQRSFILVTTGGFSALVTMHSWMFLPSFVDLRTYLRRSGSLVNMAHLGPRAFDSISGEIVQTTAFVYSVGHPSDTPAVFVRLVDGRNESEKEGMLRARQNQHVRTLSNIDIIPGRPLVYWMSEAIINAFRRGKPLEELAKPRQGMATADNGRFLRNWHEVSFRKIGFGCESASEAKATKCRWFPYNKGGGYRKWYGNCDLVVDWEKDGNAIRNFKDMAGKTRSAVRNPEFYFKEGITWTTTTSNSLAARKTDCGFLFDVKGSSLFPGSQLLTMLGFIVTPIADRILSMLNPTTEFQVGNMSSLPILVDEIKAIAATSSALISSSISLARADWDNFETSWDFHNLPLLRSGLKGATLAASWQNWEAHCQAAIRRMQELETENNRLFIAAYGLQGELKPEVPEDQITLARADVRKDMAGFLSYAVGCMMGRYSLDAPGLILANAGDTVEEYLAKVNRPLDKLTFTPDEDGIIPVLDGEWFEDDIVARTRDFLRATFGEAALRENLRFIEESLGKDLRKYFLNDFYKDHLQTYKKRPIYWLVQSPKKGFSVLIYLHRYTRDTMNLVLNRYLRDYQVKLRNRLAHLTQEQATASSAKAKTEARKEADKLTRTLTECEEWERQTVLPLAQARIELNLDDGVKVNYLKLGEALAPIAGLAAKEED